MKISDRCYMISGLSGPEHWVAVSGFITGNAKTLIIDAGMTWLSARTIHGYAHHTRPDNDLMVAVTEPHFDHIGGNCFFKEQGIDIFSHKDVKRPADLIDLAKEEMNQAIENRCRKDAKEADAFYLNTRIVNPNQAVSAGDRFDLGGTEVEVVGTPGHTPANLSYYVPDDRVMYTGDAMVTHYIPNLEAGEVPDWNTWLHSLDIIENKDPVLIVPGHGDLIRKEDIPFQIERIRKFLTAAIAAGKAPTQ